MENKILIADDHSIVKMGLTAILNKMRVQNIDTVNTIEELKAQISTTNYTHLILDIIMPDGNSLELIESINTNYPALSILGTSVLQCSQFGSKKISMV